MKALTKVLAVLCLILISSSSVLAEETWVKGDPILTFFLCAKEKDIMDVALADSKDIETYGQKLLEKRKLTINLLKEISTLTIRT